MTPSGREAQVLFAPSRAPPIHTVPIERKLRIVSTAAIAKKAPPTDPTYSGYVPRPKLQRSAPGILSCAAIGTLEYSSGRKHIHHVPVRNRIKRRAARLYTAIARRSTASWRTSIGCAAVYRRGRNSMMRVMTRT